MESAFQYVFKWSRPTTVPFPHIWHRFQAKSSTGKCINARIEDLTPDRHHEVWKFLVQHYFPDEPIAKAVGVTEDEASLASLEKDYKAVMKQNASLITVVDEPGPKPTLMGAHVKCVISKDEPTEPPPKTLTSPADKYNYICINFREGIDVCREFDCDSYYDDFGLCVEPEFRGLGVAENMLFTSREYAIKFKIRGELVTMVNPTLRQVAHRFGFRLFREVAIKDIKDEEGNPLISSDDLETIHLGGCQFY